MSRLINNMEKMHAVVRIADTADRRTNLVHLTQEGRELEERTRYVANRTLKEALYGLTTEEIRVSQNVLKRYLPTRLNKEAGINILSQELHLIIYRYSIPIFLNTHLTIYFSALKFGIYEKVRTFAHAKRKVAQLVAHYVRDVGSGVRVASFRHKAKAEAIQSSLFVLSPTLATSISEPALRSHLQVLNLLLQIFPKNGQHAPRPSAYGETEKTQSASSERNVFYTFPISKNGLLNTPLYIPTAPSISYDARAEVPMTMLSGKSWFIQLSAT